MRPEDDQAGSARAVSPPAPFPVAVGDADGAFTTAILTASEASKVRHSMSLAPCCARLDLWTCFFWALFSFLDSSPPDHDFFLGGAL